MATPAVPSANRYDQKSTAHGVLRRNIDHHTREADRWCCATYRALAIWGMVVVAMSMWSAVGVPGIGALVLRGSALILFGAWFGWCRSNYTKNEHMRNLWSALEICLNEVPTPKARNVIVILRDIEKAVVRINSGDDKTGLELLKKRGNG